MRPSRYKIITLTVALIILFLDQISKHAVRKTFSLGDSKTLIPGFFDLTYVRNTGAVCGCLHDRTGWLVLASISVLALICVFWRRIVAGEKLPAFSIGCIAGGIIGNLVDRIKFGWVVDFLDFYAYNWHWPAFNVADAAICVGVGLYLLASVLPFKRHDN